MSGDERRWYMNNPASLLKSLGEYSKEHRAAHWAGTFASFLESVYPVDPRGIARSSHQYIWDMMRAEGFDDAANGRLRCQLFEDELYGINDTIERVVDYFKAASAGSEVGRRLLLLLGPPSGGKSTMVILLKRGLEEYSRTEAGALYGIHGCPVHQSPLHLVPHTLRGQFRASYGVDIQGELCPYCVSRLQHEFHGDFIQMPVQRIFISEAGRVGVGT
jgi:serine protein kinase